jgi:hypothetical protein
MHPAVLRVASAGVCCALQGACCPHMCDVVLCLQGMYGCLSGRLSAQDQDQEVKEAAITAMAALIAQLGDTLVAEVNLLGGRCQSRGGGGAAKGGNEGVVVCIGGGVDGGGHHRYGSIHRTTGRHSGGRGEPGRESRAAQLQGGARPGHEYMLALFGCEGLADGPWGAAASEDGGVNGKDMFG